MTDQPTSPPSRTGRIVALAAAAVVLVASSAAAYLATRPDDTPATVQPDRTMRIIGYLTLERGQFIWDKNPPVCSGWRGYDDLRQGTQVVITDAAGTTIALTQLPVGEPMPDPADDTRAIRCVFAFTVDAPVGQQFYGIEVARRGRQQYTPAQLERPVYLSIG